MTAREWEEAFRYHGGIRNEAAAKRFMIDIGDFAHGEMGSPRPPKPWWDRFAEWKIANPDEFGYDYAKEAQA